MSQANASDSLKSKLEGGECIKYVALTQQFPTWRPSNEFTTNYCSNPEKSAKMTCSKVFSSLFIQFNSTEAEFMNVQFR